VRIAGSSAGAFAVGAYITAAYWFTASTSFANPAVTLARAASDTFAGIRPVDVPAFIGAQVAGAVAATLCFRWLVPTQSTQASNHSFVDPADYNGSEEERVALFRKVRDQIHEYLRTFPPERV
jgi:glycerol uptake facilitator-like aquaporin